LPPRNARRAAPFRERPAGDDAGDVGQATRAGFLSTGW